MKSAFFNHDFRHPRSRVIVGRHGVAIVDSDNFITKLVEKPETMEHKSALTGIYYFSEGNDLVSAIGTQIRRGKSLNNEYYLADAVNILATLFNSFFNSSSKKIGKLLMAFTFTSRIFIGVMIFLLTSYMNAKVGKMFHIISI